MSEFKPDEPVLVAGRKVPVQRILGNNAGPMTGPGTNTYLIGRRQLAVVDPGPADPAHIDAILRALGEIPLRWILVTHTHSDHSPGATPLARATGAELVGIAAPMSGRHDREFSPSRSYTDGEVLRGEEYSVRLIHTPGHVSNHFCYLLEEESLLFTGDHILQGTTSVILPPDGDMGDYMDSLASLRRLSLKFLAPGHGSVIDTPLQAIDALIAHRLKREQKIVDALVRLGETGMEELTLTVYDDVASHLLPWARLTLEAHLIKLQREARVDQCGQNWRSR